MEDWDTCVQETKLECFEEVERVGILIVQRLCAEFSDNLFTRQEPTSLKKLFIVKTSALFSQIKHARLTATYNIHPRIFEVIYSVSLSCR
jgi:hypothetical protein